MDSQLLEFEMYLLSERRAPLNTSKAYVSDIKHYVAFLHKHNVDLVDSSIRHAQEFLGELRNQTRLVASTIARKMSSLKIFFAWAAQTKGWHNYTCSLACPKLAQRLPCYLTTMEIDALLACVQNPVNERQKRNKIILYLLYVSGMRISELTQLTTAQLYNNCLTVQGKGGKERLIPLPETMIRMLEDYRNTVHQKFIQNHGTTAYLFPVCYAGTIKPISRQSCWVILKDICAKSRIKKEIWPHQLRHSLATHLLHNGADLRSLQLLLGHENIATVQIYTHLDTRHLRKVYDKKHPRS